MSLGKIKAIAIGASTGGIDALEAVLTRLPADSPPILIAMHLKAGVTKLLASRINELTKFSAKEAETNDTLRRGHVLIAPGGMHMKIVAQMGQHHVQCYAGEKVHHVMPSADVLFDSVANCLGQDSIGIILTGIGRDGAQGLLNMKRRGAVTIGQDEKSCAVYGMPKVAKEMGAVEFELSVNDIADKISSILGRLPSWQ